MSDTLKSEREPEPSAGLTAIADLYWQRLWQQTTSEQQAVLQAHEPTVRRLLALSDFIAQTVIRWPSDLIHILNHREYAESERVHNYGIQLRDILASVTTEEQLKKALRHFRHTRLLVIAWRELLGLSPVDESFRHLSALAETLIIGAYRWLYAQACRVSGIPHGRESGEPQHLYIFGMGKLGGGELNFSSDIDLIFAYPERGETQGARRALDNQVFFTRLGQQLIQALHQTTEDGFVYRVDMCLRPFGNSGPLVASFAALEDYYQQHGRNWERYAMVKARVLGDADEQSGYLSHMLKPFVYRRYVDFGAIDALRKMKALIVADVRRKGLHDNIKLGAGGIRDIEFIVQAHQLIRGGREPALQVRHLLAALAELQQHHVISAGDYQILAEGYRYLRRVENVLQEIGDQQTQTLPETQRDRERLILALHYPDWDSFYADLQAHHQRIHQLFTAVIGDASEPESDVAVFWQSLWHDEIAQDALVDTLQTEGLPADEATALVAVLLDLRADCLHRPMGPQGREAMGRLMPYLLQELVHYPQPAQLLGRLQLLLQQIATRTAYLQLLAENPGALKQLLRLCAATPLIPQQLARYPVLLDELLDPAQLYSPLPLDQYRDELRQYLLRIPEDDTEQQMEALRQFKQIQLLKIAAADIAGVLPLMKVSDHLTWLAEALLAEVIHQAWTALVAKHGLPPLALATGEKQFAVIAYGKLGGIELGYGSDLDVVFVHDGEPDSMTDGAKPLTTRQFYIRLAQRIIHLSSTQTASGILYEIDMELRPSGNSGMLVSSLPAYAHYQQQEAWVWEHQALVRSRVIYGNKTLAEAIETLRAAVLSQHRDPALLAGSVQDMRQKMRDNLVRGSADQFDLKQSSGGMIDIEFIAQYLVLAHANRYPEILTRWSDNVRIFEACVEAGLLTERESQDLKQAYIAIRDRAHRCSLLNESRIVPGTELLPEREAVMAAWDRQIIRHLPAVAGADPTE